MNLVAERALVREDLKLLNGEIGPATHSMMKRMRDSHHNVARLLASGARVMEVAYATGYSSGTISRLKSDPAFVELIEHYRVEVKELFQSTTQKLAALSRDALDELNQRLEEDPNQFSNKMLLEMAVVGADRSGAGPTSKSIVVHTGLSSQDLNHLKQAAQQAARTTIIDVTQVGEAHHEQQEESKPNVPLPSTTGQAPSGEGAQVGEVIQFPLGNKNSGQVT